MDLQGVEEKYSRLFHEKGPGALRAVQDDFVTDIINTGHTAWPFRQLALVAFFKDNNRNPRAADYTTIKKALLLLNPDVKDLVLNHEDTPAGLKIILHSNKLNEISPLVGLPISVLDASGTGAMDAWAGAECALDLRIDLSRSSTWDLNPLNQIPTLQELRLVGWLNKDYSRLLDVSSLKRLIVDTPDVANVQNLLQRNPAPPKVIGE